MNPVEKILLPITNRMLADLKAKQQCDISLLGGDFGCIVYLYYAAKNGLCNIQDIHPLLDKVFMQIKSNKQLLTYCNGIAGVCAGLLQLEKDGFIEGARDAILVFRDNLINGCQLTINTDLDFLHGSIGLAFPLLNVAKQDEAAYHFIKQTINILYSVSKLGTDKERWFLYKDRKGNIKENLSLSHGIASTVIYISRCLSVLENRSEREKSIELLEGIGKYLIKNMFNPNAKGCYTPMKQTNGFSRLAWCYGDIGTSIALRAIGQKLDNKNMNDMAFEIALFAAEKRREIHSNYVMDACLCHGSSGLMAFFNNCNSYYKEKDIFSEASEYWKNITFSLTDIFNGYREFGYHTYDSTKRLQSRTILEGNAGVGLALLGCQSFINNILLFDYDV